MTKSALCDPVELYPNNIPSHDAIDDEGRGEPLQDWDTRIVNCKKRISLGQLVKGTNLSPHIKTAVQGMAHDQRPVRTVPYKTH